MNKARITIPGLPVVKARPRRGRGGHFYSPRRNAAYEEMVAFEARRTRVRFGNVSLKATITLYSPERLRGDIDNYAKAILDGLQKGQAFDNDKQIVGLHVNMTITQNVAPSTVVVLEHVAD